MLIAKLIIVLIVTLGKSETYKETIKEKSTILPYSIHKRIHVRPLRNLIQGIHVNVNTIQSTSTVLKEAAIRNSGLRHARAGPGSIRAKRRKESSGTPIIHDRSSLHTLHSPNQDGIPSLSESSTRYTLGNTKGASMIIDDNRTRTVRYCRLCFVVGWWRLPDLVTLS